MSSFEETFGKLVNKTVDSVEGFVNQTAEHVSDFLKGNTETISQSSEHSTKRMGSTSSKTSSSSTTTTTTSATTSSLIPPFSVAYGVNGAGKTVLYAIDVSRDFPGCNQGTLTVGDLQNHLFYLSSLPVQFQTLIHKGVHLRSETLLVSLKLRDGAKMMMLGKTPPDPDEKYKKALSALEDEISVVTMKVMDTQLELESSDQAAPEARKALHKQFLLLNENFMRILMKVDGVEIPADRTEARAARKAVVVRLHMEMEVVDSLVLKCCPAPPTTNGQVSESEIVFQDSR